MEEITITLSGERVCRVFVESGCFSDIGKIIKDNLPCGKVCVITDDRVAALYLGKAISSLKSAGINACSVSFESGESGKSVENYTKLISTVAHCSLTRSDAILALGGGVTGDIAGFVASTYLRGIPFIQVPTTLIAQTDSSIGGKNGVNLPNGKNLLGTFYQPALVICDPDLLKSLPENELRGGVAEIIKYGAACDEKLFCKIENGGIEKNIGDVIKACVNIKKEYVQRDEFDNGSRRVLNFGHTIGHALEKLSGYTLSHGMCVGTGMALIAKCAVHGGMADASVYERIVGLLTRYGIPSDTPYTPEQTVNAIAPDKKRSGDDIFLILPKRIGCAEPVRTDFKEACGFLLSGLSLSWT